MPGHREPPAASHRAWRDEVAGAIGNRTVITEADVRFHPRAACEAVQRVLDAASDPVLVCDGGEFGQWSQALCTAPVRIINGLSGAIGGGLCHALAAKLARPEATVVAMMGDGSAGFHFTELDTAVREEAAFLTVIGNDFRWNAEHQIQLREYGPNRLIGCDLAPSARYDLAAAGLGCHGEHGHGPGRPRCGSRPGARERPAGVRERGDRRRGGAGVFDEDRARRPLSRYRVGRLRSRRRSAGPTDCSIEPFGHEAAWQLKFRDSSPEMDFPPSRE